MDIPAIEAQPPGSGVQPLEPQPRRWHHRRRALRAFVHPLLVRYALVLIVAGASLGIALNEITHRNASASLHLADALAEAKVSAASVLQRMSDAETHQRAYLLRSSPEELEALAVDQRQLARLRPQTAHLVVLAGMDAGATARTDQSLQQLLSSLEEFARLARTADPTRSAQLLTEAETSRSRMRDIRGSVLSSLDAASAEERSERVALDRSLEARRIAVMVVIVLAALLFGAHLRHLRLYDRDRAARQRALEDQVQRRTLELRRLAGYLLTVREDEKAHLARELHDEMGSVLTAAKLDLARIRRLASADPALLDSVERLNRRLMQAVAMKRRIVEGLRPSCLDILGLKASLTNLCSEIAAQLGVPVHTALDDVSLSPDAQLAVYRFVQEALTNVSKYARASEVRVGLSETGGRVRVDVEDDGIGFDPQQTTSATHGLAGMRFRLEHLEGHLSIDSRPGAGTRLNAVLPMAAAGMLVPAA